MNSFGDKVEIEFSVILKLINKSKNIHLGIECFLFNIYEHKQENAERNVLDILEAQNNC